VIPSWFDDTYHHATVELADAQHAWDDQRREDARIERRIRDLTDDLNQIQPHCQPHDAAIAASRDDVTQAQDRQRHAERAVTDSGPFSRRTARRDLTDATDNLATAKSALEELTRCAAPLFDRRDRLRHEHDRLRQHATTNRRLLRLLDDHETNVADATQTVDALDTWMHWAAGHRVSPEQLADAVDVLHHTDRADHTALAAPLATWMDQHALTPRQPSVERDVPRIEPPGVDIGF
jgi:hypothetical protein